MRIAASLALVLAGTAGCTRGGAGPTAPDDIPPPGSSLAYAALGASDVAGVGASQPCLTLFGDCPESTGYVFVAARQLRARGYTVQVSSLGLPTAVISPRMQALGRQHGRDVVANILEQLAPFLPRGANLVTIFTGANDVHVITAALGGGAGGAAPEAFIDAQVREFEADMAALLAIVRERAPAARIVVLNLPNMGALPSLAGATRAQRLAAQRASVRISTTVLNRLILQGARVVDLLCDTRLYQPGTYSSDGFHPSDAGYAILASEIVRAFTSSPYPAPQDGCPQMTLVP